MIRTVPRVALGASLTAARLPAKAAAHLLPGTASGRATVAIDRLDATVRETAGVLLGDSALATDALRRRAAADERARALDLRETAETRTESADENLRSRRERAQEDRENARRRAEQRTAKAREEADAERRRAKDVEQRRKREARAAEARRDAALEQKEREERLEALEERSEALEEREDALTAAEEAERLAEAAAEAKARRKSES